MKIRCKNYATLLAVTLLAGCAAVEGNKQSVGAIVGAVAGSVLGNQVGGGRGKIAATILGGAAGAYIGAQIGASLDERDRLAMEASTRRALATGQNQRWESQDNAGVSGSVQVVNTTKQQASISIPVLKERVKETPPLDFIRSNYSSTASVNVRGGPSTEYVVIDSLRPGEQVQVVGKVQGKNWYMISQGGVGSGFVATRLLNPVPPERVVANSSPTPAGPIADATVSGLSTCRDIQQTVTLQNGETRVENVRACQDQEGSWVVS